MLGIFFPNDVTRGGLADSPIKSLSAKRLTVRHGVAELAHSWRTDLGPRCNDGVTFWVFMLSKMEPVRVSGSGRIRAKRAGFAGPRNSAVAHVGG